MVGEHIGCEMRETKLKAKIKELEVLLAGQKAEQKYLMGLAAADAESLRASNEQNEAVIRTCNRKIAEVERWNVDLRVDLASANETHKSYVDENNRVMAEREALRAELATSKDDAALVSRQLMVACEKLNNLVRYTKSLVVNMNVGRRQYAEDVAWLKEALKPFADASMQVNPNWEHEKGIDDRFGTMITFGHLHKARAALACRPQEEKP